MKNRFWNFVGVIGFLLLAGILIITIVIKSQAEECEGVEFTAEKIVPPTQPVLVIEVPKEVVVYKDIPNETELTEDEIHLLAELVHAEAGNQDQIGKRLVVDVVLNRMYSEDFPDTVKEVIYQKNQFSTVPKLYKQILDESDFDAVYKELKERLDTDIVFFQRYSYSKYGSDAYIHGAHYFSNAKEND